ncbi:hypothetical protein EUA04_04340 [Mycolicibacterium obuense]|uniref:Uncharacterized protein n=1 Tax=Mycolicibacterium obuense TaxID=1807 RepID=A0A0J6VR54_9MYCO|nr:hypothetical protein [Mycolicibacterium obuense]KMO72659.1 hypothetical protein MOBUDSM44075_04002 [Mycolicibacterium obuense]OKH76939.1 hypothetical protein EB72_20190 [Mycobacterium sp. SWH-M1]TDL12203.1 hypothetical protein EUA04_04340 [Mycolicibacterium obuense]
MASEESSAPAEFLSFCGLAAAVVAVFTVLSVFGDSSFADRFENGQWPAGFDTSGAQAAMVLSVIAAVASVLLVGIGVMRRTTSATGAIALVTALIAPWYGMLAFAGLQLAFA